MTDDKDEKLVQFAERQMALAEELGISAMDVLDMNAMSVATITRELHLKQDDKTWEERKQWLHEQLEYLLEKAVLASAQDGKFKLGMHAADKLN